MTGSHYTGTDNLEAMKEAVNYNRFLAALVAGEARPGERLLDFGAGVGTFAHALADRIAAQDPLAVRISKAVFHAPREAHPVIDTLAQGMLFESEAKFDRMQAFLDRKKK